MKLLLFVSLIATVLFANESIAVNRDQLWLPRDYYRHFRSLYKAAEISEQTERCQYVIAGTLSQERSTKEHPVFIVTCRDQERQTFAYIVDGLSLDILNRPAPPDPEMLAQQELQKEIEKKWMACQEQIKKRTRGLRGIAWLGQETPEAKMDGDQIIGFEQDFNASDPNGYVLHFKARCHYEGDKKHIDINARLELENQPAEDLEEP